jgi:hypothetical protein
MPEYMTVRVLHTFTDYGIETRVPVSLKLVVLNVLQ